MGAWWWLVLAAVVALSVVAALTDGGARLGPRRRRTDGTSGTAGSTTETAGPSDAKGPEQRPEKETGNGTRNGTGKGVAGASAQGPALAPREGELWWTLSPGLALVLVLAVREEQARVADVTAEGSARNPEAALPLPPGSVPVNGPDPGRNQGPRPLLEPETVRRIALAGFRHKAGELDQDTWARALRLTGGAEGKGRGG